MRHHNDSQAGHGDGGPVAAAPTAPLGVQEEQVLRMRLGGRVAPGHALTHSAEANAQLLRQLHALEVRLRRAAGLAARRR